MSPDDALDTNAGGSHDVAVTSGDTFVGQRIKEAREARGLGMGELARRLGVNRKTVGNWERHGQVPTIARIRSGLRRELGLTAADLGHNPRAAAAGALQELTEGLAAVQGDLRALSDRVQDLEARQEPQARGRGSQ